MIRTFATLCFLFTLIACSSMKYEADSREQLDSFVFDWMKWKLRKLSHLFGAGEHKMVLHLGYDEEGYLADCKLEWNDYLSKVESEIYDSLIDIKYTAYDGLVISIPVNFIKERTEAEL